jgi:hypothetical protein
MGCWGVGIFQNDIALEVKDLYERKLKIGKSNEEAIEELNNELSEFVNDIDDSVDFWLALSSIMHDYGRLTDFVKKKAMEIIEANIDEMRWEEKDKLRRSKVLSELKTKLLTQQPDEVKVRVAKKQVPQINPNEIYYLTLDDDVFINEYFYNFTVYVLVDSWVEYDNRIDGLGDEHALIYLKVSDSFLSDLSAINDIPFFNIAQGIDQTYVNLEDKRIRIDNRGFSSIKKRLTYVGTYNFRREDYNQVFRWGKWESVYENYKGEKGWNGHSSLWSTLIQYDIPQVLREVNI